MAFPLNMRAAFGVSSPSAMPQGDPVDRFRTTILPSIRFNQQADLNQELARRIKLMQAQADIEKQSRPQGIQGMQTVMAPGQINPLQAAELALKKAAEAGKTTRAEESIAAKRDIAGAAETGRSSRAELRAGTQKAISDDKIKLGMKQLGLKEDQFALMQKLRDVPDSERLKMVQDGKIGIEDLRNIHALEQIGARGDVEMGVTKERGEQQRKTQSSKKLTPQQQIADYENKARQLLSSHPEFKDYIKFNPDTNKFMQVNNAGDDNIYHSINSQIYGNQEPGSIELPKDTSEPQTYNKGDDPLGLFGGSSSDSSEAA